MFLGEFVVHTAHQFKTALKSVKRLKDLLKAHPDLQDALVGKYESPASGYIFEFRSGGTIEFIARSGGSGRGFTGDLLILDEAQELNDDALGALLPALSATSVEGDPQVWFLGSAPGLNSEVWHRRRQAGRAGGTASSAYFEFSADPDVDIADRDAWAQANPGLGIRISEEFIADTEFPPNMSPEMFARERLSISPDLLQSGGVFGAAWLAVCDPEVSADAPAVFAVDVNPERSAAAIVLVGAGPTLEVVDYRPGTEWLVDRCAELRKDYSVAFAVDKSGPVGSFIADLKRCRVRLVELDGPTMARASGSFFDAVAAGTIRVRQHLDLDVAVAGAVKRPVGDAWVWGRKASTRADISPLVAATAALYAFANKPKPRVRSMAEVLAAAES